MKTIRRITFLFAVNLLGMLVTASTAAALHGGIGGRPANPDPANPRTQSIFIYTLKQGQSKIDAVDVANNTDSTQTIALGVTDAEVTNTGSFACKQNAEPQVDAGQWITLSQAHVTLGSGTNIKVPFTVTVPSTADAGEHDACLTFEAVDGPVQTEGNVRIRTRSAVRVAITVPGKLTRSVDITAFGVSTDSGTQTYTISLRDSGNVSADTDVRVSLQSLFGNTLYQDGGGYPVLAHNKLDLAFVNKHLPFWGGWYRAVSSVTYDSQPTNFGTTSQKHMVTKHGTAKLLFVTPAAGALILYGVVILAIAGVLAWLWQRRREKKDALRNWRIHVVRKGETIQFLASKHDISWQKLAKINNIKPPYVLNKGDKLQLPESKPKP